MWSDRARHRLHGLSQHHVYLNHAGQQNRWQVAYPIRQGLEAHPETGVFVDGQSLTVGDGASLHTAALQTCHTAVMVLSFDNICKREVVWELLTLLRRVRRHEAVLVVVPYDGHACLEALASPGARCYTTGFWTHSDCGEMPFKAPTSQELHLLQLWAWNPTSLPGCTLIHRGQWTTTDELAVLVESATADLLRGRGQ